MITVLEFVTGWCQTLKQRDKSGLVSTRLIKQSDIFLHVFMLFLLFYKLKHLKSLSWKN